MGKPTKYPLTYCFPSAAALAAFDASLTPAQEALMCNPDAVTPPGTSPPNQPPTVVLTLLAGHYVSDVVQVSTIGSTDVDGSLAGGLLSWGDASTSETIVGAPLPAYTHTYAAAGTYTITLTLTDNQAAAQTSTIQITLVVAPDPPVPDPDPPPDPLPPNVPPTAVLTYVSGQFAGQPYVFSTAGSGDILDGVLVSGAITWGDGSAPQTWGVQLPSTLTHTYALPGTYAVTYAVTDDDGATTTLARAVVIQAVSAPVNQPPVAGLTVVSSAYVGSAWTFGLTATDPDGSIAGWVLNFGDGTAPLTGTGAVPTTRTHTFATVGGRTVLLTVTDNQGATGFTSLGITVGAIPPVTPPITGDHSYFNALVARASHWKSYSLRDAAQIALYRQGARTDVTYTFPLDPDPRQQDAAKVVIADFPNLGGTTLAASITAAQTTFQTTGGLPANPGIVYKIDSERMLYVSRVIVGGVTTTTVTRGAHGTTATSHAAGAPVGSGTNSLQSQVRLPMGTAEGHTYLTTWDAWYGAESKYPGGGIPTWKTYQFGQGTASPGSLGLEVRTRFTTAGLAADEIGTIDVRRYLEAPESPADVLLPQVGTFAIKAETWTRYWVLLESIVGDYDRFSLWVADETRGAVQLLDRARFEAASKVFAAFWLEFNTSQDPVPAGRGAVVCYVKNVVMLLDEADVPGVIAGAGAPPGGGGGGTPPPSGGIVVTDTFTTDVDVELSAWVSDNGAIWDISEHTGLGTPGVVTVDGSSCLWKVAKGRDWISPMNAQHGVRSSYIVTPPAPLVLGTDYYVEFPLTSEAHASGQSFTYIMLRRTAADTFYGAGWYHRSVANDTYLFKVVGGVYTQLVNTDGNFIGDPDNAAQQDMIRFQVSGTTLSLFKNGVVVVSATDAAIAGPGLPGIGMGNIRDAGDRVDSSFATIGFTVANL